MTESIAELFDLSGKGAIVTGGGMGIGQAICYRLSEAGAFVMVVDINIDAANETVQEIASRLPGEYTSGAAEASGGAT